MPLYEYRCEKCGRVFEVLQKYSDDPLTTHEDCGGKVEKLISVSGLQFKGSGFYITDYSRGSAPASSGSGKTDGGSGSSDSGSSKSDGGSESKSSDSKSTESKSSDSKPATETKVAKESKPASAAKSD
jgi:putative FmdB family regulatory protein